MALSDFFSLLKSTIYADSEEKESETPVEEPEAAEEEEEEPEDLHPFIRDECKETKCAQLAKHFEHCQEKVHSGQGYKGEDCVEEMYVVLLLFVEFDTYESHTRCTYDLNRTLIIC
ncbi:hypothetical protein AN958_09457 [Leucoagaricus sp. SymC.cos]|nr:hypothetical protein AN958_09457 [Leucoagaricus sp. SymC.cos]